MGLAIVVGVGLGIVSGVLLAGGIKWIIERSKGKRDD